LQTLWQWHAAEESEHRCTAFDLYTALGGGQRWRIRTFHYVTVIFLSDVLRQTVRNLWHDGSLFQWRTWSSGARLLFARDGMLRGNYPQWRDYLSSDFHPSQHDASRSQQWLRDNTAQYSVVGQGS
jgi:predicted metal-dependent hydrolase